MKWKNADSSFEKIYGIIQPDDNSKWNKACYHPARYYNQCSENVIILLGDNSTGKENVVIFKKGSMNHKQKTTLLKKVIMWRDGYDSYPHVKYSIEEAMSTPTNAFSSTRIHDGRKTGQWVHNTKPLQWWTPTSRESEVESEIWQPLKVMSMKKGRWPWARLTI